MDYDRVAHERDHECWEMTMRMQAPRIALGFIFYIILYKLP